MTKLFFKIHIPLGSSCNYVAKVQERSIVPMCRFVLSSIHTVKGRLTSALRISHKKGRWRAANRKQRWHGCVLNGQV